MAEWMIVGGDWWTVSLLIALISFFMTVLVQMVGSAFGLQNLSMWAKSEYMQVFVTFLILLSAAAMQEAGARVLSAVTKEVSLASGNVALSNAASSGISDPFQIGKAYLDAVIRCDARVYKIVYTMNIWFEAASKLSNDQIGVEAVASGFAMSGQVSTLRYIASNMIYLALFHHIQYSVLLFSEYSMLQILLPVGLALRAFAFTRGVGGFVTAFALGFAFVFPMTYVLIVALMPDVHGSCTQLSNIENSGEFQLLKNEDPCFNSVGQAFENYYKLKMAEDGLFAYINYLVSLLGLLFLQGMFYPLAALIVTFTFIRQTGNLLGADLAEIGRGLIKII